MYFHSLRHMQRVEYLLLYFKWSFLPGTNEAQGCPLSELHRAEDSEHVTSGCVALAAAEMAAFSGESFMM